MSLHSIIDIIMIIYIITIFDITVAWGSRGGGALEILQIRLKFYTYYQLYNKKNSTVNE